MNIDSNNSIERVDPKYLDIEAETLELSKDEILKRIKSQRYKDFDRIRDNNLRLFELASKCAEGALIAAQETHDTTEYKTAADAIEKAQKINDKVLENHKKLEEIENQVFLPQKNTPSNNVTSNTVNILATTAEILKSIEDSGQ